jgi:lipopolysaccharide transport system ATP-binding protein
MNIQPEHAVNDPKATGESDNSPTAAGRAIDTVIKLSGVSKKYNLYNSRQDRLKEALHPRRKKYHREFYALSDINLEVKRGEVLGIVGKNGSGKSTLLKIISGILTPSGGAVEVKGKVVALLELGAGFNPEFTGMENIYFYCALLGYTRQQTDGLVDDIVAFAELDDFINQPIKTYSSGMKARLGFSVAVNVDPEILILDEVLAVGDELFRRKCYARMEEFFKGGKTILFVSHSVSSINELCTRAVMMDSGECILEGPTKMVTSYYQKYLYAKKGNEKAVKIEILDINKDNRLKEAVSCENAGKHKLSGTNEKTDVNYADIKDLTIRAKELVALKPYYIPELRAKSTLEYRNCDVIISDIEIRTIDNNKVNVLVMNEEYIFSYNVLFNINITNVVCSCAFKNEKGLNISSINTSGSDILRHVQVGESYSIEWRFKCLLLPGTYYTNIGIRSVDLSEEGVLNRIVDACAFKVMNDDTTGKFNGLVSLDQYPIINKE